MQRSKADDLAQSRGSRISAVAAGALITIALGLIWFAPIFAGRSFSTVGGHQTAVYPWHAYPSRLDDKYPQSDQADLNYPWQSELTASLRSGSMPWWNPNSFGGQPFFGNGSSGLFYPPRLFTALTASPAVAHDVFSVLHVVLAGLFMYLFLLDLDVGVLGALLGAVAWMFGSFTLGWIQLEVVAPIFALLPLGMMTIRRAVVGSLRWIPAAAAVIGLLLVSGHLPFAGLSCLAILGYGVCRASSGLRADLRAGRTTRLFMRLTRVTAAAVLGGSFAAIVLIPTAAVLSGTARQTLTYGELRRMFLLPPSDLRFTILRPPLPITQHVMHQAAFVGTLTAILAIVGVFSRRNGAGLGRGLIIAIPLVAVGGPVTWLAYHLVPGMTIFRPWSRLLFLFDFGLAVLGAVGLDRVVRFIASRERAPKGLESAGFHGRSRNGGRSLASVAVGIAVVAITSLQLGIYGHKINPPFEPRNATLQYPATPLVNAVRERSNRGWPDRIVPVRLDATDPPMLFADESLVFGIDSLGGYDSAVPLRTVDMLRVVQGERAQAVVRTKLPAAYVPTFSARTMRLDLLPRLGVNRIVATPEVGRDPRWSVPDLAARSWRLVYTGPDGQVFAWTGAPTGPRVVYSVVGATDSQALLHFSSRDFDFQHEAILSRADVVRFGPTFRPNSAARAVVVSSRRGTNSAEVVIDSSAPGLLVIPDMWDRGWRASVSGRSVPVLRANFNQRGVPVPKGRSVVRLHYSPPGYGLGLVLSIASLSICLALLAWPSSRTAMGESLTT